MAVSGWLVWTSPEPTSERPALFAYGLQLILNAAWSAIFFGLHHPGWALVEICILWLAIVATILLFRRRSKTAAVLLMPCLVWVSFATGLNCGVWYLN